MTQVYTLPNGLRYILLADECPNIKKNQKACFMQFFVQVGGKNEPLPILGISHLLEHLLFSGTKRYSQILKSLDRLGARYNAHTTKELTSYHVWVSARKALEALRILIHMLFATHMPEAKIKKEKQIVRQEMREFFNNHQAYIHELMGQQIFSSHPLGQSVIGTPETLKSINREILLAFYHQYYRPENIVLVIQGKIDPRFTKILQEIPIEKQSQSLIGSPTLGSPTIPNFYLHEKMQSVFVKYKKQDQTLIGISFPMFGLTNNLKYHASILSILVGGNFSSYLYNLRETYALVYSIHSKLALMKEGGYFYIKTTTRSDAWIQVLGLILDTLEKLPPVTEERLREVQDYIHDHLVLNFKDPQALTEHYGHHLLFLDEILDLDEYLARYRQVTVAELQKLQDQLLDFKRINITIIGPHEASDPDLVQILSKYGL